MLYRDKVIWHCGVFQAPRLRHPAPSVQSFLGANYGVTQAGHRGVNGGGFVPTFGGWRAPIVGLSNDNKREMAGPLTGPIFRRFEDILCYCTREVAYSGIANVPAPAPFGQCI